MFIQVICGIGFFSSLKHNLIHIRKYHLIRILQGVKFGKNNVSSYYLNHNSQL